MSRHSLRFPLALVVALPWVAAAQMNAPLTGGAAAQSAAVAAPVPSVSAAPAASQTMPDRAVVRQVQTPMPAAPAAATATPTAVASTANTTSADANEGFGDVTRGLLAAQADGRRAGGALPILGPVSTAAWDRYLESFRQPIPQWFAERVKTDSK